MGIFLMSFMITISLKNSPMSFLNYQLSHYAFNGILCILMARFLRAHPLNAWRTSMLFSITQMLAVIFIDPNCSMFPLIIGFLSALEGQLYWRPKEFLEIKEVSNKKRYKFNTLRQIIVEAVKIVMPVILGIVISDAGYTRAANIVLVISSVQLLLSILLRPTSRVKSESHSIYDALKFAVAHKQIRRLLWLQTLRGFAMTGCAYGIVAQLNLYNSTNSNMELGNLQAAASLTTIILLLLYRHFRTKKSAKSDILVYGLLPASFLLPISAIVLPGNFVVAIALYIYTNAVITAMYSSAIFSIYNQNAIKKTAHDDVYRIEIEILGELWLCIGRAMSIFPLLLLFYFDHSDLALPLITVQAAAIPIVVIATYRSVTSRALGRH